MQYFIQENTSYKEKRYYPLFMLFPSCRISQYWSNILVNSIEAHIVHCSFSLSSLLQTNQPHLKRQQQGQWSIETVANAACCSCDRIMMKTINNLHHPAQPHPADSSTKFPSYYYYNTWPNPNYSMQSTWRPLLVTSATIKSPINNQNKWP